MNIHGQHFLCFQINLLLPREASGTSASCNVPRDSHFALLLNQEGVQSFSESWMLSIQRKRLLFTCKHLFPTFFSHPFDRLHFSHFFRRLHREFTMKLGKGNKALCCYNCYLCEGQTKLPSHKKDWQTGSSVWEGWGTQSCHNNHSPSVLEEGV